MAKRKIFYILLIMTILACVRETKISPPVAQKIATKLTIHGDTRIDNYYWMNQRNDSTVIRYLKAENAYTNALGAHMEEFRKNLYNEMIARIKKDDKSVPYKSNGYYYYTRTEGDAEYPLYCRKKGSLDTTEEIMLNVPAMAEKYKFYDIGALSVSTNNKILAYAVDTVSRRKYTIHFKNLETGELYKDKIPNTSGSITWANDNKTVFYTKRHAQTLLPYQVYKHKLGESSAKDELVYEEKDNTYVTFCYKTKSKKYIIIGNEATLTSEYRFLEADKPDNKFEIIHPREHGIEYSIEHYNDHFYIITNWNAKNFCLMKTPVGKTTKKNWKIVIPHRKDVLLDGIEIFKDYLVVEEKANALNHIRIINWHNDNEHYLDFEEEVYATWTSVNPDFDTKVLRYGYTSLTTPRSIFDYNMEKKEKILMKEQNVIGDFDKQNYMSKRTWALASDGTKIPISIVCHVNTKLDGKAPLYITGYGSYGNSYDTYFSSVRLSLLDRGFIYAIAHIRGGQEMGRAWYEDGKLLKKKNTFTDFIDCTQHLVDKKWVAADKIFASGGSAGGLLIGAVANMRPELYRGLIADVPFVDVVTTMLDENIPLTTGEFDEWGNPKEKKYYDYMLSYSPYDNVAAKAYPNMLVTTGFHDSQVQYWEPAKWVAKLRELKTDNNTLLFKIEMDYGHGGASGRFERLKETSFEYAFIFDLIGIKK